MVLWYPVSSKNNTPHTCDGIYLVLSSNTSHSDYFSSRSHHLVQTTFSVIKQSISFMWGPYLVHKRILMIDKQIEHAANYFSKA